MKLNLACIFILSAALILSACAHQGPEVKSNSEKIEQMNLDQLEMSSRIEAMEKRLNSTVSGNEVNILRDENRDLDRRVAEIETMVTPLRTKSELSSIKIKVLAGDGRLTTAKQAAGKLKELGYSINRTDKAPKGKFSTNKVFYAEGYSEVAGKIASSLGPDSITRPLTWPSIFDIIVVALPGS